MTASTVTEQEYIFFRAALHKMVMSGVPVEECEPALRKLIDKARAKWKKEGGSNRLVDYPRYKEETYSQAGMGGGFNRTYFTPLGLEVMKKVTSAVPAPTYKGCSAAGIYLKWAFAELKKVKTEEQRQTFCTDLCLLGDWLAEQKGLELSWEVVVEGEGEAKTKTVLTSLSPTDLDGAADVKLNLR